ncbi:NADP-dependent oxidoreductase domain-containing protein [Spinellus fusiger]|nr:NADP-dependent oxidoreductase domain-containing protein [Spinellus fusiger]
MSQTMPTFQLNTGHHMPVIGYGTFSGKDNAKAMYLASKEAIKVGYRFFDTAYSYGTEHSLGQAIKDSNVPREEFFINAKLAQSFHEPRYVRPAIEASLKQLGLDYLDMYMIHWPMAWRFTGFEFENLRKKDADNDLKCIDVPLIDTWRAMEQLVKEGLTKTLGVSNFTIPMLKEILSQCEIPPAVLQMEIHPCMVQEEILAFCKENGILCTGYSPLGNPDKFGKGKVNLFEEPAVVKAAEKYGKTPSQVLINWGVARGYSVIPKSVAVERMKSNIEVFSMDPESVDAITEIGRHHRIRLIDPFVEFGPSNDPFEEHTHERK